MEIYLTIEGLAKYLQLAEQTIRRWVLNREIPYHKIKKVIRFRLSEIEKWVDNGGICKMKTCNFPAESEVSDCDLNIQKLFDEDEKEPEELKETDDI